MVLDLEEVRRLSACKTFSRVLLLRVAAAAGPARGGDQGHAPRHGVSLGRLRRFVAGTDMFSKQSDVPRSRRNMRGWASGCGRRTWSG